MEHRYFLDGFTKVGLDDSISCFSYLAIYENFKFVEQHHRFNHIEKERIKRLTKEGFFRGHYKVPTNFRVYF